MAAVLSTPAAPRSAFAPSSSPRISGLLLNGKHVQVQRRVRPPRPGLPGAAAYDRAIERQVEILKSMGCNAIRTSHNPPAPKLLEVCDRLGMLVMDEAFDEWKKNKTANGYGRFFDDWQRARPAEHAPPRPQPPLRGAVEHRQRDPRAGRQSRRAAKSPAAWPTSAMKKTRRGPSPRPATIPTGA